MGIKRGLAFAAAVAGHMSSADVVLAHDSNHTHGQRVSDATLRDHCGHAGTSYAVNQCVRQHKENFNTHGAHQHSHGHTHGNAGTPRVNIDIFGGSNGGGFRLRIGN